MKINDDDIPGLFTGISDDRTTVTFSVENPTDELLEKLKLYYFGEEVIKVDVGGAIEKVVIVLMEQVATNDAVYFNLYLKAVK